MPFVFLLFPRPSGRRPGGLSGIAAERVNGIVLQRQPKGGETTDLSPLRVARRLFQSSSLISLPRDRGITDGNVHAWKNQAYDGSTRCNGCDSVRRDAALVALPYRVNHLGMVVIANE